MPTHEQLYRRTCESFTSSVREGRFPEQRIAKLAEDLKRELAQCLGFHLIGQKFHDEMMATIDAATPQPEHVH